FVGFNLAYRSDGDSSERRFATSGAVKRNKGLCPFRPDTDAEALELTIPTHVLVAGHWQRINNTLRDPSVCHVLRPSWGNTGVTPTGNFRLPEVEMLNHVSAESKAI